ncbi:hypothetical protein MTR_8g018445 [Medicago truncatula]|uniref:Uncharacterized protein n=1 Tax=Medicago truncatula TaxID=3880 RepID=A0A072TNM6_MEDTR|nr:hypothetical protein MTR_8g018445 [Medicago truncatula]
MFFCHYIYSKYDIIAKRRFCENLLMVTDTLREGAWCSGYVAWWVLSRDISDHYLLVFKVGDRGWGPNPFCFNNFWLEDMKFKQVVEDVQENQNVRFDESGVENKT